MNRKGETAMNKAVKENTIFANIKNYFGLLIGFFVLCVIFTVLEPTFLSTSNIMNVLRQISVNAVLAYGMTFVLLAAGIDLSMGSMVSFASVFCAYLISMKGMPVYPVVIAAVLIGGVLGCVNGLIVTKTGMWPFIVTLSTSLIIGGLAYSISKGSPIRIMNETFNKIGTGFIGPVSLPVIYMLALLIICYIILQRTRLAGMFMQWEEILRRRDLPVLMLLKSELLSICLVVCLQPLLASF